MIKRVNELDFEKVKALLGDKNISEEQFKKLLEQVKAFCKVAYQLYAKKSSINDKTAEVRELHPEPPQQFTNVA
jgi:hypothetical protein